MIITLKSHYIYKTCLILALWPPLDLRDQVLHRSFTEPWGAEFHVATLRALLRSRQEATDAMEPMEP